MSTYYPFWSGSLRIGKPTPAWVASNNSSVSGISGANAAPGDEFTPLTLIISILLLSQWGQE